MPAISFGANRANGTKISTSRTWLSTQAFKASAQMHSSDADEFPSSWVRAWAMSVTVRDCELHSRKPAAQSMALTGTKLRELLIVSRALLNCFHVTIWVRGAPAIPRAFRRAVGSHLPFQREPALRAMTSQSD